MEEIVFLINLFHSTSRRETMKKMLLEVDTDECKLTMSDGSKWSVNPGDITICCTWLPTS